MSRRFERIDLHSRFASTLLESVPHIDISYETDLENNAQHQATTNRLCQALGIPSGPVESVFTKLATRPLRESVLNFEELDERMRETKWAALFESHR